MGSPIVAFSHSGAEGSAGHIRGIPGSTATGWPSWLIASLVSVVCPNKYYKQLVLGTTGRLAFHNGEPCNCPWQPLIRALEDWSRRDYFVVPGSRE